MLMNFNQFLLKKSQRSPLYLLNPNTIREEEFVAPRFSIIHYLDLHSEVHFPTRDLYYFNEIPANKKVALFNITDLVAKDEVTVLENKYVQQEIRKWYLNNLKAFRLYDLTTNPIKDVNNISIYNYNLLKDLYRYKTSIYSRNARYTNLFKTLYYYVKKALEADAESYQFIRIDLPELIPSYPIFNLILKYNEVKLARVIDSLDLRHIIDIYMWLLNETRPKSILREISDEDSKRIIIEYRYKGYLALVPLYLYRMVSQESTLDSPSKVHPSKVGKLFLLNLIKIKNSINAMIEKEKEESSDEESSSDDEELESEYEGEKENSEYKDSIKLTQFNKSLKENQLLPIKELDSIEIKEFDSKNDINELLETFNKELDSTQYDSLFIDKLEKDEELDTSKEIIPIKQLTEEEVLKRVKTPTIEEFAKHYIEEAKELGLLSSTEIKNIQKALENRKNLKSPYNPNVALDSDGVITKEDIAFTDKDYKLEASVPILDEHYQEDKILKFDKKYIKHIMKKDIINCVKNIEKSGIIITDYSVEVEKSALGNYEIHSLKLKPIDGKESTVYFRLPVIDEEGEMVVSGIKVRMRKQKTDLPIRKISPTRVALTSNYSKLFIFRTERKAFNEYNYIVDYIRSDYLSEAKVVKKIYPGNVFDNTTKLPTLVASLARNFRIIELNVYTFILNHKDKMKYIDEEVSKQLEAKGLYFLGYHNATKEIIAIDENENIINFTRNEVIGDIADILDIPRNKIPKSFSAIKVLGSDIPLGVTLSYYLGLDGLISLTKTPFEVIESHKQYKENKDEVVLRFSDYKLILKPSKENRLLFNGFYFFKDFIKNEPLSNFNDKEIYLNLLLDRGFDLIHLKELDLLRTIFLDPITVNVLEEMNEPTEFIPLLLRANEMLKDYTHPDINDPRYSRIRGFDRVPGLMYRAIAESIRDYKFKYNNKAKINLDPYKVWNYVTRDNTVKISEDVNPIAETKEMEVATLTGIDGLNKDAIPVRLRKYHKYDKGVISEATVDSSDVGVNIYLTPYAKFENIRGLVKENNKEFDQYKGKIFSTSALLAPFSEYDDMKRINFISIQNGHTIASEGYMQPLLRTGYEYVMPYRVGKLYCAIAKDDGVIKEKNDKILVVEYQNGEKETVTLGTQYGRLEGSIYPHVVVSDLKVGDKVKKGDYLAYNKNFFEKDWLYPNKLIMKFNKVARVALSMSNEVFEDSSGISKSFSKELNTEIVKERIFIIDFKKSIINLLPVGTEVKPNDVLFTLLDEYTDYNNLSQSAIDLLQSLASTSPKAKVHGVIDRYEVKYNGELSDMSDSLRKLCMKLDKEVYEKTKGTSYEVRNNKVTSEYRSEGKNLNIDTLEFKVFIRVKLDCAIGDKLVFGNQMKSIVSTVFPYDIYTESGEAVDAFFSYKSILNRVVNSPILQGTTIRLLRHISKKIVDLYFNKS